MKKFLVILMVVAMASFLFTGCLFTTPEEEAAEEEAAEEEVVVVPATVAPIITSITDAANVVFFSLTSTATQYMNKAEVAAGIIVHGTAPTYSEVKVYVDDVCAGTADTGVTGIFAVVVAKADLGADAADKVIYATAKEAAIDVSAHSVEYAFVLDTDLPGISAVAATADQAITAALATGAAIGTSLTILTPATLITVDTAADLVVGVWRIDILGATTVANNVRITSPTGVETLMSGVVSGTKFYTIPGVEVDMVGGTLTIGESYTVTCVAEVAAITDRYTLKFDEDVDYTGATAGTYAIYRGTVVAAITAADPVPYKTSNDTGYWNTLAAALTLGETVTFTVSGVTDLAGNPGGTVATPLIKTCNAGLASATTLAP